MKQEELDQLLKDIREDSTEKALESVIKMNMRLIVLEKEKIELKSELTKAKDHIKKLLDCLKQDTNDPETNYYVCQYMDKAEQFLKEIEK